MVQIVDFSAFRISWPDNTGFFVGFVELRGEASEKLRHCEVCFRAAHVYSRVYEPGVPVRSGYEIAALKVAVKQRWMIRFDKIFVQMIEQALRRFPVGRAEILMSSFKLYLKPAFPKEIYPAFPYSIDLSADIGKSRPVCVWSGDINDIGISFASRELFKLQVMISVGIEGKFDHTAEAFFPVVMQRSGFFSMNFLNLSGNLFFMELDSVQK